MTEPQSLKNHGRYVPLFHFVLTGLLVVNVLHSGMLMQHHYSGTAITTFVISISLLLMGWYVRAFPVTVQNRVIRLEQRMRFQQLLPADVAARAGGLPIGQIVALRFACDAELPGLVNEVLAGLSDPKAIKQKVTSWQGDFLRA